MSELLAYTSVGVFNPANTLIAQGSQQLRFTGSVTVSVVGGQTVVNVGGGGSVSGDPNTLAFFDNTGTLADTTAARFLATRTLGFHQTLNPFPINANFIDCLVFGSFNFGASSSTINNNFANIFSNGETTLVATGAAALANSVFLGNDHTLNLDADLNNAIIAGRNNSITNSSANQFLAIIGSSNVYTPSALVSSRKNVIIGDTNSIIGGAPIEAIVSGYLNTINTGNDIDPLYHNGRQSIYGSDNSFLSPNPIRDSILIGIQNIIQNNGVAAPVGLGLLDNVVSFGNLNSVTTSSLTANSQLITQTGIFNQIIISAESLEFSIQSGYGNVMSLNGALASFNIAQVGVTQSLIVDNAENSSMFGFSNTISATTAISMVLVCGNDNELVNGAGGYSDSVVIGNSNEYNDIAERAQIVLVGRNLTAPSNDNCSIFGAYNDAADSSYVMQFGVGSSGLPFTAFGVKSNNQSVDLKTTNYKPETSLVLANNLTVNSSLIELDAAYTINTFDNGVNAGQILAIRMSVAGTTTINPAANILLPGASAILLTEDSTATFLWSTIKSAWTLQSLTLY